jgi:hypothetical protein
MGKGLRPIDVYWTLRREGILDESVTFRAFRFLWRNSFGHPGRRLGFALKKGEDDGKPMYPLTNKGKKEFISSLVLAKFLELDEKGTTVGEMRRVLNVPAQYWGIYGVHVKKGKVEAVIE